MLKDFALAKHSSRTNFSKNVMTNIDYIIMTLWQAQGQTGKVTYSALHNALLSWRGKWVPAKDNEYVTRGTLMIYFTSDEGYVGRCFDDNVAYRCTFNYRLLRAEDRAHALFMYRNKDGSYHLTSAGLKRLNALRCMGWGMFDL